MNHNFKTALVAAFTCFVGVVAGYGIHAQQSNAILGEAVAANVEIKPILRLIDGSSRRATKVQLGTLQATEYSDDAKTRLYFKDAPVTGSEKLSQHVNIFAVIDWGDHAAFVISTSCGGSGCVDSYYILSVGKVTAPQLIEIPELYGTLDQTSISVINRNLVLDFGFRDKMRTIAEFDGKAVKIHSTTLEGAKLPEEACRWLFDVALNNCMNPNPRCDDTPWSGVASRGYHSLRQHQPGINASEFEKLCKSVCVSRQGVAYPLFQNMVCHQ